MRPRVLLVGLAIVGSYLAVVSATITMREGHVRPLYDGLHTPIRYRFVNPPAFFASGNVEPTAMSTTIALGAGGSEPAGLAAPDGQFVINLARGAIAPAVGATKVSVRITPFDPDSLGPLQRSKLPPMHGLVRPSGNAYHLAMTYEPDGRAITRFAKPGTLLMEIPEIAQSAYRSIDGEEWSRIATHVLSPGQRSMSTALDGPGYYVAGTNQPSLAAQQQESSRDAWMVGIGVALIAVLMFLFVRLAKTEPKPKSKSSSGDEKPVKKRVRVR